MLALATTHYRLPDKRLLEWVAWNVECMAHFDAHAFVTTDCPRNISGRFHILPYPLELQTFSICKTSNFAIRAAIDAGAEIVVKTDIDVILPEEFFECVRANVKEGRGLAPHYMMALKVSRLHDARRHPKLIGTLALHARDWERICGFNENMWGYGFDDCDVRDRALKAGINVPRDCSVYHIAHEGHGQQMAGRKDHWNRDTFNPLNKIHNFGLRSQEWQDANWGRPLSSAVSAGE